MGAANLTKNLLRIFASGTALYFVSKDENEDGISI